MKQVLLSDVCEINPRMDSGISDDTECSFVPMEYVDDVSGTIANTSIRRVGDVKKGYTFFKNDDVIFAKITPCMENGKCAIGKNLKNGIAFGSTEYHVVRAKEEIIPAWIYHFLRQEHVRQSATHWFRGTAGQQRVPATFLEELKIPLPPLTEQKRIASLLARADRLRHLRRTAHDLGESLLQSVFLEMFGDPARNEKGWDKVELAELVRSGDTINYGVVQPGDDFPNGKPIIRVGDLENLSQNLATLKLIDPKIEANYKRSRIVGDEILIACVGSIGRVALVNEKMKGFNIVRAVARVPANYSVVNRLYLAAYLSTPFVQDFFQKETRTVSQPTLNITQIEEAPILLPPLNLQEEFAGMVARVESLRGRMSEGERQVEGLFGALLAQSFDGGR